MKADNLTIQWARARLEEAADVLRRLPRGRLDFPADFKVAWPDVVRASIDAYGYDKVRTRPAAPSPQAIARMEATLPWLYWLDEDERRIVWARANRISWPRLAAMDGKRSERTLRNREYEALSEILLRLRTTHASLLAAFVKAA